jgi:hypothetical protein
MAWRWLIVGPLIAALAAVSFYAVYRHQTRHILPFADIEHTPPPEYVSPAFLEEVRVLGAFPAVIDTRRPGLARELRDAFARHPWVAEVADSAAADGRVRITLRYRTPAAVVIVPPERYLIDAAGVRLPCGPRTASLEARLIEVHGVTAPPAGPPGTPWDAPGLRSAAELARLVEADREALGLVAIDIAPDPLRPDLRLRTKGGTQIVWQLLGPASASDAAPEEKLRRLRTYRVQHGDPDLPPGPYLLDLRPAGGIVRRQLNPGP